MINKEKEYIDTLSQIPCNTFLNVKYNNTGKPRWSKYNILTINDDGTPKTYGQLYDHFTKREGFLMALGYVRLDDPDGRFYLAKTQYFGFTKKEMPHYNYKQLGITLVLEINAPKS